MPATSGRPGRPRADAEPATELGRMLVAAMEARGEREGRAYTLRDLGEASGIHWGYAARIIRGQREPSREAVTALARALVPDVSVDAALVAAGYTPEDTRVMGLLRRLVHGPARGWAQLEAAIGEWVSEQAHEGRAGEQAAEEGGGTQQKDAPAAHTGTAKA